MKQYREYMDSITASDTLHQRLLELEAPKKRPVPWIRYGAAAAACALVIGLGVWSGAERGAHMDLPINTPENADDFQPDIAIEPPDETVEPGMKTNGGYEVSQGGMTTYYLLPGIDYGMSKDVAEMCLDWDLPKGAVKRDLTAGDIAALFGGEENLSVHLSWEGYTLTGWAAWYEDGSLWGAFINGYKGPMDHFELAFTVGDVYPPTCIAYGDGIVNELWGVDVTAWGHDGEHGCDRRVELINGGYGFRFDITGTDQEQTCDVVSRVVRWIIVEGLEADTLTRDGAVLAHPWEDGSNFSVGEPNWNDSGTDTPAYDPGEMLDPAYNAPALDPSAGGQPGEEPPVQPDEVPEE